MINTVLYVYGQTSYSLYTHKTIIKPSCGKTDPGHQYNPIKKIPHAKIKASTETALIDPPEKLRCDKTKRAGTIKINAVCT